MKVYDIETRYGDYQTHSVVAESMAQAERLYQKRYPGSPIYRITLHSEYVIVQPHEQEGA